MCAISTLDSKIRISQELTKLSTSAWWPNQSHTQWPTTDSSKHFWTSTTKFKNKSRFLCFWSQSSLCIGIPTRKTTGPKMKGLSLWMLKTLLISARGTLIIWCGSTTLTNKTFKARVCSWFSLAIGHSSLGLTLRHQWDQKCLSQPLFGNLRKLSCQ